MPNRPASTMTCSAPCVAMPGVAAGGQRDLPDHAGAQGQAEQDVRAMVVGIAPAQPGLTPGWPPYLVAGRQITRGHYEAVADIATGFTLGERSAIRRNHYTVVGLTRRMVSSSGDPMVFIPLKDAAGGAVPKGQRCHLAQPRAAPKPTRPSTVPACLVCSMP